MLEILNGVSDKIINVIFFEYLLNVLIVVSCSGFSDVVVFVNDDINRKIIEVLKYCGVKYIVFCCVGFNNVDVDVVVKVGIIVSCVFVYSFEIVVEYIIVLIFMLNWKIYKVYNWVCEGNFNFGGLMGFMFYGKIVGVIGIGKIG